MEFELRSMWEEESVPTPRMPDPVRAAAVRAALISAVSLTEAVASALMAAGHSWLSAPMMLATVLSSVVASWAVLDVWVTRQVWNQRNGVVSRPSSAARALRRERRRERRAVRAAARRGAGARQRENIRRGHLRGHLPWAHGA